MKRKFFMMFLLSLFAVGTVYANGAYGPIDDLTLNYDGNQLINVRDSGSDPSYNNAWNFSGVANYPTEYFYDKNGNVTKDLNKNISSIQYNFLNLPTKITFMNGNTIKYTYAADGRKLRAVYSNIFEIDEDDEQIDDESNPQNIANPSSPSFLTLMSDGDVVEPGDDEEDNGDLTLDYCGNIIYKDGRLEQMFVDGGYVTFATNNTNVPTYHFYIQDHLGNNRVVVQQDGTVEQVNHYYPYGGLAAESTGWDGQRYKYNGKELDRMHGLDLYDYGARYYDGVINRWTTIDPLCEKYYNVSPYAYCAGNPVNSIDSEGKLILFINGYHFGDGGSSKYWNRVDKNIMQRLHDNKAMYIDGSLGGIWNTIADGFISCMEQGVNCTTDKFTNSDANNRYNAGLLGINAKAIYDGLDDGESIKIVTHSMGGAYGKGVAQSLVNYAKENGLDNRIDFELDIAPYQPTKQKAVKGINTWQMSHRNDKLAGYKKIKGLNSEPIVSNGQKSILGLDAHEISSFGDEINKWIMDWINYQYTLK